MFPAPKSLGVASYGASTFFASAHPSESCGSNGLPLTPNSIKICGWAHGLYQINHANLCSYIDVIRGKHERIIIVQEYYPLTLRAACQKYEFLRSEEHIIKFSNQILNGLSYLNEFGTVSCNLSPETILVDPKCEIKIYGYGFYYMTEAGTAISFPIGSYKYLPPELLLHYFKSEGQMLVGSVNGNPTWDSWSLGMILLETLLNINLFERENIYSTIDKILTMATSGDNILHFLVDFHNCASEFKRCSEDLQCFLEHCLTVDPEKRLMPCELLELSLFSSFSKAEPLIFPHFPTIDPSLCLVDISQYKSKIKISEEHFKHVLEDYPRGNAVCSDAKTWLFSDMDHLAERKMNEVYHLWQLAGGNVEQELKKQKMIHTPPSILTPPRLMAMEGEIFGEGFQCQDLLPTSTIVLPLHVLRKRLEHISIEKYFPLITQGECNTDELETSKLPLVIREKDVEYQFHRIILFERLLKAYPYKLDTIIREARKDIPPFYRALIWASLLRIDGAVDKNYEQIDKETSTSTDRQIEVDIPRCHQYDELLSSPRGHAKFTRILKAWVVSHPQLVYWQGLDSLCASFLYLNFENEALAYSCLSAFINKYLHNFFLQDNSAVIQEYLAKFSHLIAFHDPLLFNHLHIIGFVPELYSIPWFLTMFTHVFPLHKIFLLWDTLLLGGSSLPLCIGVALLRQLKDRLLQFGFNECILLFSDMPDINMEQVVVDAVEIFCSTPGSLTFRQYDGFVTNNQHEQPNITDKELLIESIALFDLKNELCGRVSGADLIELMAQRRSSKPGKPKVLLLDIRPIEEFSKGFFPGSINVPCDTVFNADGELNLGLLSDAVLSFKSKIIVVMGSIKGHEQVLKFAHALLDHGLPRVCTLHKGVDVFRSSGLLIVSSFT